MTIDAVVTVLVETHRHGRCRSCAASLTWYQTAAGRWMPFDGQGPQLINVRRDMTAAAHPWIGDAPRQTAHRCSDAAAFRKGDR